MVSMAATTGESIGEGGISLVPNPGELGAVLPLFGRAHTFRVLDVTDGFNLVHFERKDCCLHGGLC